MQSEPFAKMSLDSPNAAAVTQRAAPALQMLADAHQFAADFQLDIWQFAVEFACLAEVGLSRTDCRWLVHRGLLEHRREVSLPGDRQRSFLACGNLRFSTASCFVLTDAGAIQSQQLAEHPVVLNPVTRQNQPRWLPERHELWVGDILIKRFRVPAQNQEAVLQAFQEEHWPHRIDDPLPVRAGQDPKRRLHDTINSLNRNQKQRRIRFSGDGTGQGICWELMES